MSRFLKVFKSQLFWLLFLTFVIRGAVLFFNVDSFTADPDGYMALAENLRTNGVFGEGTTPTAFRPPLYPAILRGVLVLTPRESVSSQSLFLLSPQGAVALLHWVLGILTVWIVYRLALILTFPRPWAFFTALLTAVDPILLFQSRQVMTETLAALMGVLIIWLLTLAMRPREKSALAFFGIGILAGLAGLCRPVFFVFGGLVLLGLLNYLRMRKSPFKVSVAFCIGFAAVILGWGLRNQYEMKQFIPATTHGGYTLYLANNPSLFAYNRNPGPFAGPWDPEDFHKEWEADLAEQLEASGVHPGVETELRTDELASEAAHEAIERDTKGTILAAVIRVGNLWQFLPYQTSENESSAHKIVRYTIGVFYAFELILALIGLLYICAPLVSLVQRRGLISPYWSNWSWLTFLLLAVQIPHLFYWTNMRMRAPLMTIIPIFAVVGIRLLLSKKGSSPVVAGGPPTE